MHKGSEHMIFHQINQLASTTRSNQHYQQPTSTNLRLRDKNWIQEMNQGLRGDGAGEDVDGDLPPPDERIVGDDAGDDFPLPEGSFPGRTALPEPQIGSAKVPPRGGGVSSRKLAYDFFSDGRLHIEEDEHRRATRGPTRQGARPGGRARPHPHAQGVGPLWYFLRSVFFIISKNNFRGVLGLLELCRIGL